MVSRRVRGTCHVESNDLGGKDASSHARSSVEEDVRGREDDTFERRSLTDSNATSRLPVDPRSKDISNEVDLGESSLCEDTTKERPVHQHTSRYMDAGYSPDLEDKDGVAGSGESDVGANHDTRTPLVDTMDRHRLAETPHQ